MKRRLEVPTAADGRRLDLFLVEQLGVSRARAKKLLEDDAVRVEGRRVKKGGAVAAGQVVEVALEDELPRGAVADASLKLTVLFEDEALLFVDKPSGVPSQPLEPGETGTVANALVALHPGQAEVGLDPREAGLVHRLDVETSGVILAARTREAWTALRASFGGEAEAVDKRYLALVTGPLADEGEIDLPLAHHGDHVRPALQGAEGRPARSQFVVKARKADFALVEVRIFTGVLHQVRAHLAAVGAPIVGDGLYGGRPWPGLKRFFLHAASLTVPHPTTGAPVKVESPLTPELARTLDEALGA